MATRREVDIAESAIGLYREYVETHGYEPDRAAGAAVLEVQDGLSADADEVVASRYPAATPMTPPVNWPTTWPAWAAELASQLTVTLDVTLSVAQFADRLSTARDANRSERGEVPTWDPAYEVSVAT